MSGFVRRGGRRSAASRRFPHDADATPGSNPRPLAALLLIPVIAVADVLTGTQVTMSTFYLVGVLLATAYGGRRTGRVAAGLSALAGYVADLLLSEPYLHFESSFSSPLSPVWNAVARAVVYGTGVVFVGRLQRSLRAQRQLVDDLRRSAATIRTLQGLLPICAWCKRMRDGEDPCEWKSIEQYVTEHTDAAFTHGVCPECAARVRADGRC